MKLFSYIFLSSLWISLAIGAGSESAKVLREPTGEPIEDLILNPSAEIEKDAKTGKLVYVIKGIYYRDTWDLTLDGKRLSTDATGVFSLRIPIVGKSPSVELIARGPRKTKQSEKISVVGRMDELTIAPVIAKPFTSVETEKENIEKIESIKKIEKTETAPAIQEPVSRSEISTDAPSHFKLASFYAAPVMAVQAGASQKNFSFTAGWTPSYSFSPKWSLRLNLGAMAFDKVGGGKFLATDSLFFTSWNFVDRFSLALGGGIQYWWTFGGLNTEAVGELSYTVDFTLFKSVKIDRVYGRFAWLFDTVRTKQFQSGVALSF